MSNLTETRQKSSILFGNLDEIHAFHATVFYPELERCGANPASVGRNFLAHCSDFRALYSSYCQNMPSARQAITDLGGEANPASILHHCQTEAGHQLPLSSYLLKPMQRLTKYQLLLKDLVEVNIRLLAFFACFIFKYSILFWKEKHSIVFYPFITMKARQFSRKLFLALWY